MRQAKVASQAIIPLATRFAERFHAVGSCTAVLGHLNQDLGQQHEGELICLSANTYTVGKTHPSAILFTTVPGFPRGGNSAIMSVETIDYGGSIVSFTIAVETKDATEHDGTLGTTPTGASKTLTPGGGGLDRYYTTPWEVGDNVQGTAVGFQELVRFKYTLAFDTNGDEGWVHFRMLAPQWKSNGA